MKLLVQRVNKAKVEIDGSTKSEIKDGFLILLGIHSEDNEADIDYCIRKLVNLRIFSDEEDKLNLSIKDLNYEILLVSQFTLYASIRKGNRPSFDKCAKGELARDLYQKFIEKLNKENVPFQTGEFGTDMKVSLTNDGPVTIIIDSRSE